MAQTHNVVIPDTLACESLDNQPDAALVAAAQVSGDLAAIATLYQRYLPRVYRYFHARTGDAPTAEDLTSQTCIAVLEALPRYRERGTFAAWLFTIAARRYADYCRTHAPLSLEAVPDTALPQDNAPLPDMVVIHNEQMAQLATALRTLSPNRAQAVALHFFGGLTHKETARAMGRSQVAVKALIHRALRDLRGRMGIGN
jgi:RNA polymerase sigma-70 factor (ECF subfamily)